MYTQPIEPIAAPRRPTRNRLIEPNPRLETMLACSPAFIIGIDRSGSIDFINRTLAQYNKADVIGRHWLSFFSPDQQVVAGTKLDAMYATGEPQFFDVHTPGPDGRPQFFTTQLAPIRDGNEIVGAVLVSQDVTEHKVAQAELLANRHMALLGTLVAGIAHEINTPVQFVSDNLQFMAEAVDDLLALIDKLRKLRQAALEGAPLGAIVDEAAVAEHDADLDYLHDRLPNAFTTSRDGMAKISKLVHSLKEFTHPTDEDKEPSDLNRIVETAVTIAKSEYKLVADVSLDLGAVPPVTCHPAEISQVVLNIVVNAAHAIADVVKGTKQRGTITVATARDGDMAVIRVSDTGSGIPEAIRARIFDPFFTTKEVGKGTGQGLAIASTMVKERHGGNITFDTEVGRGTTFTIRIPM